VTIQRERLRVRLLDTDPDEPPDAPQCVVRVAHLRVLVLATGHRGILGEEAGQIHSVFGLGELVQGVERLFQGVDTDCCGLGHHGLPSGLDVAVMRLEHRHTS
jgi:hypothetical protein